MIDKLKIASPILTMELLKLVERLNQLEEENQCLRADLNHQTAGLEQWQKRARETEERQNAKPYLIALFDGNGLCFVNRLVQAGRSGAEEAARNLAKDLREHGHQHHKNDLPRTVAVVVQIFLSVDRLANDLIKAEVVKGKQELDVFLRNLVSQSGIFVNDCHADAVQSRLTEAYELNLENCHCQHAILALGPGSTYYETLAEYTEDEYTKRKTSLIRPGGGFPEDDLPFHLAQLSDMHNVPITPPVRDTSSELRPSTTLLVDCAANTPPTSLVSLTSAIVNSPRRSSSAATSSDGKAARSASHGFEL